MTIAAPARARDIAPAVKSDLPELMTIFQQYSSYLTVDDYA